MLNSHLEINKHTLVSLISCRRRRRAGGWWCDFIYFFSYQYAAFFLHVYQINELLTLLDEARWILHLKITC